MELDLFSQPQPGPEPVPQVRIWSVGDITRTIRSVLEAGVGEVWVQGEICNLRRQASGHVYFALKDERALLSCVLFRSSVPARLTLADGMLVQARGRITVYEARGQYQMIVDLVQPAGEGILQARFEVLKRKLDADGLFDPARKRPIPREPASIGIVTSPTGAALQDFLNIARRRAPWVRIILNPVRVQGVGSAAEIAAAIHEFNTPFFRDKIDLIVVCRGGGSMEDLWAFNEEIVARAIAASHFPLVSAVGHEIDFTIADFVADLRAPTPSAAAELVLPDRATMLRHAAQVASRLHRALESRMLETRRRLEYVARSTAFHFPGRFLQERVQRFDALAGSIGSLGGRALSQRREKLAAYLSILRQHRPDQVLRLLRLAIDSREARLRTVLHTSLDGKTARIAQLAGAVRLLSPMATLQRGYSVTYNSAGSVVRKSGEVGKGEQISVRLADGTIGAQVL
jgi:exodeoxyribonuclease VII large subunit